MHAHSSEHSVAGNPASLLLIFEEVFFYYFWRIIFKLRGNLLSP